MYLVQCQPRQHTLWSVTVVAVAVVALSMPSHTISRVAKRDSYKKKVDRKKSKLNKPSQMAAANSCSEVVAATVTAYKSLYSL